MQFVVAALGEFRASFTLVWRGEAWGLSLIATRTRPSFFRPFKFTYTVNPEITGLLPKQLVGWPYVRT